MPFILKAFLYQHMCPRSDFKICFQAFIFWFVYQFSLMALWILLKPKVQEIYLFIFLFNNDDKSVDILWIIAVTINFNEGLYILN